MERGLLATSHRDSWSVIIPPMKLLHWFILLMFLVQPQVFPGAEALSNNGSESFTVFYEPSPYLAAGDIVSLEITAPERMDLSGQSVDLSVIYPYREQIGSAEFFESSDRPFRARLPFTWDTSNLAPGTLILQFSIEQEALQWTEAVTLHPPLPEERQQGWASVQVDCCTIEYITGTRAQQDLDMLIESVEQQVRLASERMGTALPEPVNVIFLPRVIGHGGFAGEELFISYPDVNYTNIDLEVVLHHEIIHRLDRELGGPHRPAIFVEGVAVYLSGGHYKEEDLVARSAALLELDAYLALEGLANDFYPSQHESGYMQAGALVHYLVESYGWDAFSLFYRNIQPPPDGRDSSAIDIALQQVFGISFIELEERFVAYLQSQAVDPEEVTNVRLTLEFYDTLRLYQQRLDPAAYFRNVWLFPYQQNRERGIVTNWTRWPRYPHNQLIERQLESAGQDLLEGRYDRVEAKLAIVQTVLPGIPSLMELPYQPAFAPLAPE
jgi:hypothetical protein